MKRILLWLFCGLLITVPFFFSPLTDELFEFNKMVLVYAWTILIAAAWIIRMIREKRPIIRATNFNLFLGLFVLSQILSTIFSIHPFTSIFGYYSRFNGGLLSILSYSLLYLAAASNLEKSDLKTLLKAMLIGGFGAALYAFPEHFGVSPGCILITGQYGVSCWIQDVQSRVFGTFGQPNWLAAYLIMLIPLVIWWIQEKISAVKTGEIFTMKTLKLVALPGIAVIIMTLTTLYTGSRSGFLGLVFALGILGMNQLLNFQTKKSAKNKFRLALIAFFALIFVLNGTPVTPSLGELVTKHQVSQTAAPSPTPVDSSSDDGGSASTVLENGGTDSGKIREIVWKGAIQVWKRYPLLGSGVETFAYSYYRDRPIEHNTVSEWDFLYNKAHNEFLNYLATTGILGLGTLLLMMGSFSWLAFKRWQDSRKSKPSSALFALALLAGYGALAISNFFGFSTVMVEVLFFLWPALLLIESNNDDRSEINSQSTNKSGTSHQMPEEIELQLDATTLFTIGIILVASFLLLWVYNYWSNDRMFADSKKYLAAGEAVQSYKMLDELTRRAPQQAEYWEQEGQVLAQLTASADAVKDATTTAQLTQATIQAADQAVVENPVHLNMWKSRARAFIWLGTIDAKYYDNAIESLKQAEVLAPTDPKTVYNLALLYDTTSQTDLANQAYETTLALRPEYEQVQKSYAQFLTRQGRYQDAIDHYDYIDTKLKPQEKPWAKQIEVLQASISAQLARPTQLKK